MCLKINMELIVEKINKAILQRLTKQESEALWACKINPDVSCTYDIDGENNISSISFWSNGLCDIDSIEVQTEKRTFRHYQFKTVKEAEITLINEVKSAIENA